METNNEACWSSSPWRCWRVMDTSVFHIFLTSCSTSYRASSSFVVLTGVVCWDMRANSFMAARVVVGWGVYTVYMFIYYHTSQMTMEKVETWPVFGALKRTTKGSLEKASTSPGRLSGYWYRAVMDAVSVLNTPRQTHHKQRRLDKSVHTRRTSPVHEHILLLVRVWPAQPLTGNHRVLMIWVIPNRQTRTS